MTTIIVDMSHQQAGQMFAASTDWYYELADDVSNERLHEVLTAFRTLGIPARAEWTIWQGEWDACEFPEDARVTRHPDEPGNLLVTYSNGVVVVPASGS